MHMYNTAKAGKAWPQWKKQHGNQAHRTPSRGGIQLQSSIQFRNSANHGTQGWGADLVRTPRAWQADCALVVNIPIYSATLFPNVKTWLDCAIFPSKYATSTIN